MVKSDNQVVEVIDDEQYKEVCDYYNLNFKTPTSFPNCIRMSGNTSRSSRSYYQSICIQVLSFSEWKQLTNNKMFRGEIQLKVDKQSESLQSRTPTMHFIQNQTYHLRPFVGSLKGHYVVNEDSSRVLDRNVIRQWFDEGIVTILKMETV